MPEGLGTCHDVLLEGHEVANRRRYRDSPVTWIRWRSGSGSPITASCEPRWRTCSPEAPRRSPYPAALLPGFDYVTHLRDPDGNLVQLYYYQQQCAPAEPAPPTVSEPAAGWPELVDAQADVFGGQQFLGPWE